MKKYYILRGSVWKALMEENVYLEYIDIPDATWKKISIVYKEDEFNAAFNSNEVDASGDYLRIL